jgi:hypothetical protein
MDSERVVRREVREETVADTTRAPATPAGETQVVRETVVEETTEAPRPAGVTNVNVNKDPVSGNVSVSTPDGKQINVNT